MGHKVVFLNPPTKKWKLEEVQYGVMVLDYQPTLRGINKFPTVIRKLFSSRDILKIRTYLKLGDWDLVWSFDPFRFQNLELFGSRRTIYHCVDWHKAPLEGAITKSADLVLTTSERLRKKLTAFLERHRIYNLGHGLAEHFVKHRPLYQIKDQIKVGLVGNLLYTFLDAQNLKLLIEKNPGIEFHFIGPYKEGPGYWYSELLAMNNIFFYGPQKTNLLPSLMDEFHLFVICYDTKKFKSHLDNPHKILEYLSTGKVTVCHKIEEYGSDADLIEMVEDNKDLLARFQEVVKDISHYNSSILMNRRRSFALQNTYRFKVDQILNLLEKEHS